MKLRTVSPLASRNLAFNFWDYIKQPTERFLIAAGLNSFPKLRNYIVPVIFPENDWDVLF